MLRGAYDERVDVWAVSPHTSLLPPRLPFLLLRGSSQLFTASSRHRGQVGVLLAVLLLGRHPFRGPSATATEERILKGDWDKEAWEARPRPSPPPRPQIGRASCRERV